MGTAHALRAADPETAIREVSADNSVGATTSPPMPGSPEIQRLMEVAACSEVTFPMGKDEVSNCEERCAAVPSGKLPAFMAQIAEAAGEPAPSANQVRRRLGAWYRGEIRDRVGPLSPPVRDLPAELRRISVAARELTPRAQHELERVVLELIAEAQAEESGAVDAVANSCSQRP